MPLRCVIVDDSADVLLAARQLLEREGLAVVGVATAADEARRVVAQLRPDVILVDIDLGRESGLELVRRLVAERGDAMCIAMSTHSEADYAELIADSPAIGFLPKSELSRDAIVRLLKAS